MHDYSDELRRALEMLGWRRLERLNRHQEKWWHPVTGKRLRVETPITSLEHYERILKDAEELATE